MKGRLDSWECRTGVLAAFAVCGGGSASACLPTAGLFLAYFCFFNASFFFFFLSMKIKRGGRATKNIYFYASELKLSCYT